MWSLKCYLINQYKSYYERVGQVLKIEKILQYYHFDKTRGTANKKTAVYKTLHYSSMHYCDDKLCST